MILGPLCVRQTPYLLRCYSGSKLTPSRGYRAVGGGGSVKWGGEVVSALPPSPEKGPGVSGVPALHAPVPGLRCRTQAGARNCSLREGWVLPPGLQAGDESADKGKQERTRPPQAGAQDAVPPAKVTSPRPHLAVPQREVGVVDGLFLSPPGPHPRGTVPDPLASVGILHLNGPPRGWLGSEPPCLGAGSFSLFRLGGYLGIFLPEGPAVLGPPLPIPETEPLSLGVCPGQVLCRQSLGYCWLLSGGETELELFWGWGRE